MYISNTKSISQVTQKILLHQLSVPNFKANSSTIRIHTVQVAFQCKSIYLAWFPGSSCATKSWAGPGNEASIYIYTFTFCELFTPQASDKIWGEESSAVVAGTPSIAVRK